MSRAALPLAPGDPTVETTDVAGLALPLLRATQAAALACLGWVGRDDPKAADGAAVAARPGRDADLVARRHP